MKTLLEVSALKKPMILLESQISNGKDLKTLAGGGVV